MEACTPEHVISSLIILSALVMMYNISASFSVKHNAASSMLVEVQELEWQMLLNGWLASDVDNQASQSEKTLLQPSSTPCVTSQCTAAALLSHTLRTHQELPEARLQLLWV